MTAQHYLGMKSGDLRGKLFAKYWNPNMASMQEQVQKALLHGVEASGLAFPIDEANRLLVDGYLPLENGFTRLDDGSIFVAALTDMPGVSGKMIDWWFGWHYMETQRYKLWHPRAHLAIRAEKMIADDPDLSDREKYLHNLNFITEYVGSESMDIAIEFSEPSMFFDVSRFKDANVSTAVCGSVGFQKPKVGFGQLIHLIRETKTGCEMRSRFWLGRVELKGLPKSGVLNKLAGSKFVSEKAAPLDLGREMLVHCAMEMNHLAGFLPALYADYHPENRPVSNRALNEERT